MYQRILSGIRPTGHIHLGNYLGAIRQWVQMAENTHEMFFCIVDQHALTTVDDAQNLSQNCETIAAAYIACGINPDKAHIFLQSHVPAHTELAWYLNCMTPLGWLNRMTQFKDKAGKNKDQANLGLYAYPVLMAADILLYNATHVPVGEDQKQHVELARDLAGAFNHNVGQSVFILPEPVIQKETARIMSLRDGQKKMSKSDISDYSRIHLLDDADTIALKIKKAKTDSDPITADVLNLETRYEAKNLLTLYSILNNQTFESVCQKFEGQLFSSVKNELSDALIAHVCPIGDEMNRLLQDRAYLRNILQKGARGASNVAAHTLTQVREVLNLIPVV